MYISDIFEDPLDEKWEVPRESICIKDFAGEGAFGYVARAEAFELPGNNTTPCTVAVKMLKGSGYILFQTLSSVYCKAPDPYCWSCDSYHAEPSCMHCLTITLQW